MLVAMHVQVLVFDGVDVSRWSRATPLEMGDWWDMVQGIRHPQKSVSRASV